MPGDLCAPQTARAGASARGERAEAGARAMGVRKAACGLIFLAGLAVAAIEQKGVDPTATQATAVDVGPLAAQFNVSDPVQLKGILGSVVAELLEGRQEKAALRAELDAVKKDKEALENKTHVVEATLRQEVVAVRS